MKIAITVIYLLVSYLSLFRISFDVVWNPSSYPNFDGGILFLYFLFMALPCILSFILNSRKAKVLRQDIILYACGAAFSLFFLEISSFLRLIGFITIYATVFDIYQLFKKSAQKSKEEKQEEKLEEAKNSQEKEDYQKEYFNSLDNK